MLVRMAAVQRQESLGKCKGKLSLGRAAQFILEDLQCSGLHQKCTLVANKAVCSRSPGITACCSEYWNGSRGI